MRPKKNAAILAAVDSTQDSSVPVRIGEGTTEVGDAGTGVRSLASGVRGQSDAVDGKCLCHFAKLERRLAKYSMKATCEVTIICDLPPSTLPNCHSL